MSRVQCKMWTCDFCGQKNRERWSDFLKKRLPKVSETWWFVTITAHEWKRSEKGSLKNLRHGLDKVMKRARRVWEGLQYVRVFEKHKKGAYHAHLIVSGLSHRVARRIASNKTVISTPATGAEGEKTWGCQTWWRRACRACRMGYMVKVRYLPEKLPPVHYILKYMTKDAQSFYEKGLRRIQTSVRIGGPTEKEGEGGWTVARYVWASDMPVAANLIDINTKEVIQPEYWRMNVVYPPDK